MVLLFFLSFSCLWTPAPSAAVAAVLDSQIYNQIIVNCQGSEWSGYPWYQISPKLSSYFELVPNVPVPINPDQMDTVYSFFQNNPQYLAVVAPYSTFMAYIAQDLNLLYYVFDYSFNSNLNSLILQVYATSDQTVTGLNSNTRVAFTYFYLYAVTYEVLMNTKNDSVLANYNRQYVFLFCDSLEYANLAVTWTFGSTAAVVVLALDQYIGNSLYFTQCPVNITCGVGLSCADACALYRMLTSVLPTMGRTISATVIVMMSQQAQQMYLYNLLKLASQFGYFSQDILWILADLWLPTTDILPLMAAGSAIYVVSVPFGDQSAPILRGVCNDLAAQYEVGNGTLCDLQPQLSEWCQIYQDYTDSLSYYTGYLPVSTNYNVSRLAFNSLQFFNKVIAGNNVTFSPSNFVSVEYTIEAPVVTTVMTQSSNVSFTAVYLPYPNNCSDDSPYTAYAGVTDGTNLLSQTSLRGLVVRIAAVMSRPYIWRVSNYNQTKSALIYATLKQHKMNASALIDYGCDPPQYCFYNASAYGFADPNYTTNYKKSLAIVNDTLPLCPLSMLVPTMDNTALYTGAAVDLLNLLKNLMGFTPQIDEVVGTSGNLTSYLPSQLYAMTTGNVIVNSQNQVYASFSSPYFTSGVNIMMSNRTYDPTWQIFYPFGLFVWLELVLLVILLPLVFIGIDRLSPNEQRPYNLVTAFWFVYGSVMQAQPEVTPKRLSSRVLAMFMWFVICLLVSLYVASMSVVLLTPPTDGCVSSIFDLLTCGVVFDVEDGGLAQQMLQSATYANLSANHKFTQPFNAILPYFNQQNPFTNYQQFAFIGSSKFNNYWYAQLCSTYNISVVGQPEYTQLIAIATPQNASYLNAINNALLRLVIQGNISAIESKWFPQPSKSCSFTAHPKSLDISDVAGLYYILLGGTVLSVLMLAVEIISRKVKFHKLKSKAPELTFGQVYEASVLMRSLEGVEIEIKAQPTTFFVPYDNLNKGELDLQVPHFLGIRIGSTIYVKYFGKDRKTHQARFALVRVQEQERSDADADASGSSEPSQEHTASSEDVFVKAARRIKAKAILPPKAETLA